MGSSLPSPAEDVPEVACGSDANSLMAGLATATAGAALVSRERRRIARLLEHGDATSRGQSLE
jgi:hypothetical protein